MNYLLVSLLGVSLVLIQFLIGGTRLLFSYPTYALIGLSAILALFFIRRPAPKPSWLCVVSAVLLTGYVLARAWFSPVAYLARTDAFMVAGCLLVYLITAFYLHATKARVWLILTLLGLAMVHVIIGIVQFRNGNEFMLFGFLRNGYDSRASGLLICPNHLAGFLEAIGIMTLSLTVWSRFSAGVKLLTGYAAAVCFFGVVITGSRGGYLSTAGGLVAFTLLSFWVVGIYNRQGLTRTVLITIAAVILLVGVAGKLMVISRHVRERMDRIGQSTQDVRVYNWLATLDQFKEAPLLGTGAGSHLWYGRQFRRPQIQADPIHSHGDYLELLAEYGIVGEGLMLVFLGLHVGFGLRNIRTITLRRLCNSLTVPRSDALALTIGALSAVLTLMAHSVVDFNMHIPGNALLFALIFGLLANPGTNKPEQTPAWNTTLKLTRAGMALAGLALIAAAAYRFEGEYWTEKARAALRDGLLRESQDWANQAIKADPSDPYPYFYLGEAWRVSATRMPLKSMRPVLFENAVAAFRQSLAIFPNDENALVRMAQALDGARDFDAAESAYLEAIRLDPNLGVLRAYYSTHLSLAGKEAEAKAALAEARRLGTKDAHTVGMVEAQSILATDPAKSPELQENTP
ncbi:MAG: O-antigen ligase family protein [Chthoniobacteraceae bacterium]